MYLEDGKFLYQRIKITLIQPTKTCYYVVILMSIQICSIPNLAHLQDVASEHASVSRFRGGKADAPSNYDNITPVSQ